MKRLAVLLAAFLSLASEGIAAEIRYLKLNDNAASTTVVATTGSNATLSGGKNTSAVQVAGPGGTITYAFDLDGSVDYVSLGSADLYSFDAGQAWTVSIWFRADAISGNLIGRAGSNFRGITLQSATVIRCSTSNGDSDFTVPSLSTGTWYHLFATRTTGNDIKLWINGAASSSNPINNDGFMTFDTIGRRSATYFDGRVSEFRLFDTDESANVATYYTAGASSSAVAKILLQLSDARLRRQSKNFDTYGVYSLAP